jgi:predicted alpha/beta hydrolase family esterase
VPEGGRLVIAAKNDHITPMTHAAKIATHFDAPLEIFRGGHLLQFGRRGAFRTFAKMLHALELTTVAS